MLVGPLDAITPSADRPTAHFAEAQELADLEELGITHDTLVVHPEQARQLRTAYAENLDDMLASAGFTGGMFSNPRIPAGTAFVAQGGMVGTVGFEVPLTVEAYEDQGHPVMVGTGLRGARVRKSTGRTPRRRSPASASPERNGNNDSHV